MPQKTLPPTIPRIFRWQLIVALISLAAIALSIIFRFTSIASPDLPLLITIILGGIPSVLYILIKLFKGDLGADLIAAIALITAVILQQYLAAVLIILMLSSGQTLEAYPCVRHLRFCQRWQNECQRWYIAEFMAR